MQRYKDTYPLVVLVFVVAAAAAVAAAVAAMAVAAMAVHPPCIPLHTPIHLYQYTPIYPTHHYIPTVLLHTLIYS